MNVILCLCHTFVQKQDLKRDVRVTWSMLSRRGSRLTRRQHSGPPRPDSGNTCRAFTVSCREDRETITAPYFTGQLFENVSLLRFSHHVGVSSAWHALARVEVEEFVDLRRGQPVSNFQLLDDENLPGEGLLPIGKDSHDRGRHALPVLPCYCHRVRLVLEGHLEDTTRGACLWITVGKKEKDFHVLVLGDITTQGRWQHLKKGQVLCRSWLLQPFWPRKGKGL